MEEEAQERSIQNEEVLRFVGLIKDETLRMKVLGLGIRLP